MGVCDCSMFCCILLLVHSSIAVILMGKRELVALLKLSSWCLVMVERLFLTLPRGCLRFVIVVFPDHTHLLFLRKLLVIAPPEVLCCVLEQDNISSALSFVLFQHRKQPNIFCKIINKESTKVTNGSAIIKFCSQDECTERSKLSIL